MRMPVQMHIREHAMEQDRETEREKKITKTKMRLKYFHAQLTKVI